MKKNADFPVSSLILIIASFALAILDMILLYTKLGDIWSNISRGQCMITAFIIATIANVMALSAGYKNGKNLAEKSINKNTAVEFVMWIFIGLAAYVGVRVAWVLYAKVNGVEFDMIGEILQLVVLAISYIGSGLTIQDSARTLFDAECVACRVARKKFYAIHDAISDDAANLQADLGVLTRYDANYKTLERQKKKIDTAIRRSEKGVMSDIVGKMCTRHAEVSPMMANKVMDEVIELNRREDKDAK